MTSRRIGLVLCTALLAGVSCSTLAQSSAAQSSDPMTNRMQTDGSHDTMFMRQAAADGLAEVELGRMALEKASSAQVRQLAQHIVDDHTMANQQLTGIAQRKNVSLPTEPMPAQKQEADRLKSLSGKDFDQAYALAMVQDHRKAIKLFGMQSTSGSDADLKQFASATLPKLKMHLQMAEQAAGASRMHHTGAMDHDSATPMDSNGSMGMPASGSSTR